MFIAISACHSLVTAVNDRLRLVEAMPPRRGAIELQTNVDGKARIEGADNSAVVVQLRPALVRFFRRRCGSTSEAEDLAQDVIVRTLGRTRWSSVEQAKGYVFRAAINLWRDRMRRQRSRGSELDWDDDVAGAASGGVALERVVESEEELCRVVAALQELGERTRDVFVLHRLEHLKYAQIAEMFGISVSAVEKHMSKALAHVARRIRHHEDT